MRSADLAWCGQCFARFDVEAQAAPEVAVRVNTRGTGLPMWARALVTAAVIGGGLVLIAAFEPWWSQGGGMWAFGALLLIVYASLGGLLVARFWAPGTFSQREERVVFLDQQAIDEVETRERQLGESRWPDAPVS